MGPASAALRVDGEGGIDEVSWSDSEDVNDSPEFGVVSGVDILRDQSKHLFFPLDIVGGDQGRRDTSRTHSCFTSAKPPAPTAALLLATDSLKRNGSCARPFVEDEGIRQDLHRSGSHYSRASLTHLTAPSRGDIHLPIMTS